MSVKCTMLAIGAERYQALRGNPAAIKNEVIFRQALDHLAVMSFFKRCMSEREVLAEIRVCQRNVDTIDDPTRRRQMAERYVRETRACRCRAGSWRPRAAPYNRYELEASKRDFGRWRRS
jgi:hypothetical protein